MNGFSNGMNANRVRNRVCLCLCVDRTKQARASYAKGYSQTSSQATYYLYLHWNRFVKGRPWWLGGLWDRTLKATKSRERLIPSILSESEWKKKKINLTVLWYLMLIFLFVCLYFGRNECTMIGFWDLLIEEMFSQARLQVWTHYPAAAEIHYLLFRVRNLVCLCVDQPKQARASYAKGLLINFITSHLPTLIWRDS